MRKFLALASITCLLSLGTTKAQEQSPAPAELVARAVSQFKNCENHTKLNGKALAQSDANASQKVTVPVLLRADRYDFDLTPVQEVLKGYKVWNVHFLPWEDENKWLKPMPGESSRYNKAMNMLEGNVYIDKFTGGILRLTANFLKGKSISFWHDALHFNLDGIDLTVNQERVGDTWLPVSSVIMVKGTVFGVRFSPRMLETKFTCAAK